MVIEIIEISALLDIGLDIVSKSLAKHTLITIVKEIDIDW